MRWWMLVAAAALLPVAGQAQEADDSAVAPAVEEAAEDPGAAPAAEDLLSDDELDDLVAPIALYPDSLLTQVLVAATYPLDVMKADRFLDENADVADSARADLAEAQDWDQSVKVLASGFPDVLGRMADDIDWTEELGDAMLAQTDDLLDAVQRMRAQAEATGNLTSNEAQTVEVEGDNISIAPADPQVVYVPSYDPVTTYTTPATAPTVVYDDPGVSFGDVLATGAIAFGSAMLVDEIFDDDDDWDDYWDDDWDPIDWDDDAVFRGRDVDIEGDVNIDRSRDVRIGDRDGDQGNRGARWEADRQRREEARRNIGNRQDARSDDRAAARRDREGARDQRRNDQAAARDARRDDIAARGPDQPRRRPEADRPGGVDAAVRRPARDGGAGGVDERRTRAEAKLKARTDAGGGGVQKARDRAPGAATAQRPAKRDSALKPSSSGSHRTAAAKDRGASSLKRDVSPAAVKARAPSASHPKKIAKPKASRPQVKAPPRKPAAHSTAFKKPKVNASRSRASASRGKSSRGRSGGGRRR
jgi:hypothetical protein